MPKMVYCSVVDMNTSISISYELVNVYLPAGHCSYFQVYLKYAKLENVTDDKNPWTCFAYLALTTSCHHCTAVCPSLTTVSYVNLSAMIFF